MKSISSSFFAPLTADILIQRDFSFDSTFGRMEWQSQDVQEQPQQHDH
jgi:hypothetical protein